MLNNSPKNNLKKGKELKEKDRTFREKATEEKEVRKAGHIGENAANARKIHGTYRPGKGSVETIKDV